jgi:hypothetical protein
MNVVGMKHRLVLKIKKMFLTKQVITLIFINYKFKKIVDTDNKFLSRNFS